MLRGCDISVIAAIFRMLVYYALRGIFAINVWIGGLFGLFYGSLTKFACFLRLMIRSNALTLQYG